MAITVPVWDFRQARKSSVTGLNTSAEVELNWPPTIELSLLKAGGGVVVTALRHTA